MRAEVAHVHPTGSGAKGPIRSRILRPPTTTLGRLSLMLLGVAIAFMAISSLAVSSGVSGDSALVLEIVFLAIPVFGAFASALAAGVLAVVALLRGERSLLLAIPVLLGAFALMFVIGELVSPH